MTKEDCIMKRAMLIIAACFCGATAQGGEVPEETVESTIRGVTVYADRALVKRSLTVYLPAGPVTLEIKDLPSKLINESVRVSGKGTADATISGVRVQETYLEESAQEDIRKLEEERKKIEKQIAVLQDRKDVLSSKRSFIDSIIQKTSESVAKNIAVERPTVDEWTGMVTFVDNTLNEINVEARSLDSELDVMNKKKSVIERELAGRLNLMGESEKSVRVDLDVADPGSLSLELSYIVVGASWSPTYDIRASSENDTISIVFMANVRQNTGEDWENVRLELSTARPFSGAVPKILGPWYLAIVEPDISDAMSPYDVRVTAKRPAIDKYIASNETRLSGYDMFQTVETQLAVADVSSQMISTSFNLKQTESILSNNVPKKVPIKVATFAGEKEYFAVPKLSQDAYLKCVVANQTNFPLLSGEASVFFDGGFVSTTRIPLVVPTESFDLYLGIDESIKLKREMTDKFLDRTGLISKKHVMEFSYRITLENYRDAARTITILDQIPVSQDDRLEIKLKNISPDPRYKDDDETKGILRWALNLEPGEKEEIEFNYEIKYPTGVFVEGLN
jgi:uncharacterized protein (TIGR02231 family)